MELISRKQARLLGLPRYFTGVPCKKEGHIAERYVSGGMCRLCNLARVKALYDPEKKREYRKQWYAANREKSLARSRAWHAANKKRRSETRKTKRTNTNTTARKYDAKRRASDLAYRLKKAIRARLSSAIKRKTKTGSAIRDLGCSVPELMAHIAAQFTPGMAWDNWTVVWQLDHIKPLAMYDMADPMQFAEAVRYTNLQPLRIEDHRRKSAAERALLSRK